MQTKLLTAATGNGRSTAFYEAEWTQHVKVLFSGTIGGATIAIETSPDGGTTFIPSGATFATASSVPVVLEMMKNERVYANMTGASGTTATVHVLSEEYE